jgi:hypothetical protein
MLLLLPWRNRAPRLELLALGPDGRFEQAITVPAAWADTERAAPGVAARVPLVLAVRNTGRGAARPERLELSAPVRVHLSLSDGRVLPGRTVAGSPLIRYELTGAFPLIEPGRMPRLLPGADTLWLELVVPSFYCMTLSDSVPEFVPAPRPDPAAVSRAQIFYSFEGEELKERQTGLLTIQLDPALVAAEVPEPPPSFPVEMREPSVPLPSFGWLRYEGSRRGFCGEPEEPIELLTTVWSTPSGGRFFVLDYGGAPRKYLFDLDRDSIIELEIWDPDADGRFEARRAARLAIPPFLLPRPREVPTYDVLALAALPDTTLARYDRFRGAMRYGPREAPSDTATRRSRFRPLALGRDRDEDDDDAPRYAIMWGPGYAPAEAARPGAAPRVTRGAGAAPPAPDPSPGRAPPGREPAVAPRDAPPRDAPAAADTPPETADRPAQDSAATAVPGRRFREPRRPIRLLGTPAEAGAEGGQPPPGEAPGRR